MGETIEAMLRSNTLIGIKLGNDELAVGIALENICAQFANFETNAFLAKAEPWRSG